MPIGPKHILPSENSPEIFLSPEGLIKIKGRAMVIDRTEISQQILDWIDEYLSAAADVTTILIAFEYLNSFSTSILVSMLKKITLVVMQNKRYLIRWYYEEDDEDILERGEYVSETYDIPIEFIKTQNISIC